MHLGRLVGASALLLASFTSAARAQLVRGDIVDRATGRPLYGALVILLDERDQRVAGAIADSAGRFALRAPAAGRYRLRADRIGYRSTLDEPVDLTAGATVERRLAAPAVPISLAPTVVRGADRCAVRPEEGSQALALWMEVRKALEATAIAREEHRFVLTVHQYERILDPTTQRIVQERTAEHEGLGERPFATPRSAEDLQQHGWVQRDSFYTRLYAPDADVLLSDAFTASHCFHVEGPHEHEQDGLLGLAFEPARKPKSPDVRGVLWMDPRTAELRYLEFRHVGAFGPDVMPRRYGGRIDFRRLDDGAWIVQRWWMRWPEFGADTAHPVAAGDLRDVGAGRDRLADFREVGGEVVTVAAAPPVAP